MCKVFAKRFGTWSRPNYFPNIILLSYVKAIEVQITQLRSNSGGPDVEGNAIIPICDMQWDHHPQTHTGPKQVSISQHP